MNNNVAKCHWCFVFKPRLFTQYVVSKDGMHKKSNKVNITIEEFYDHNLLEEKNKTMEAFLFRPGSR